MRAQDPYVRKTAAVCVAKLYDINAELVEDQGFLQILRDLICDPNPTVRSEASAPVFLFAFLSARPPVRRPAGYCCLVLPHKARVDW